MSSSSNHPTSRLPVNVPSHLSGKRQQNQYVSSYPQPQPQHVPHQVHPQQVQHGYPQPHLQYANIDQLTAKIMAAIGPILATHQSIAQQKFEALETSIRVITTAQDSLQKTMHEGNLALQQTLVAHTKTVKNILTRLRALENIVGKRKEGDDATSIAEKIDTVNHSMGEFLERAWDPYAFGEKRDMAVQAPLDSSSATGFFTRQAKTPEPATTNLIIRHEMGVSPIKDTNPNSTTSSRSNSLEYNGIGFIAATIPDFLKLPRTSDDEAMEAQSPRSESASSCRLTSADWTKQVPATFITNPHVNFFRPDLSIEGRKQYSSLPQMSAQPIERPLIDVPSPSGSHVPSSRTPSPIAPAHHNTFSVSPPPASGTIRGNLTITIPVIHPASHSTSSSKGKGKDPSENPNGGLTMKTLRSESSVSPTHSAMEEDSVLQMVTRDAGLTSSVYGSPSTDPKSLEPENRAYSALDEEIAHDKPILPACSLSGSAPGPSTSISIGTSASAPISEMSPADDLSDLTSLSDVFSDTEREDEGKRITSHGEANRDERPRKRQRLSRQASQGKQSIVAGSHQPPKKRGRKPKASISAQADVKVKQEPGNVKQKPKRKRKEVAWPKTMLNKEGSSGTVIQCDFCSLWFHCGCVGYAADDPNLEALDVFKCPPCTSGKPAPPSSSLLDERCARPDCPQALEEDIFFVERIIGRRVKVEGGFGRRHLWLVKWFKLVPKLFYPVSKATWEGETSLSENLITQFSENLAQEGVEDEASSTLLLKEATEGGWNLEDPEIFPASRDWIA
ncbi:hypothetical protein BDP27DRAFT_1412720 [Rhodocollybia butyracea]|uniref:Uncharacterized protein n=1 Tax=Rhodocollybia butyracea TaxID=206335 RepID=A0A9P5QC17_9AGAR|nr:hypothetical protein BDP27DRAFT_1412720 [Rhodocollybia butyracea]